MVQAPQFFRASTSNEKHDAHARKTIANLADEPRSIAVDGLAADQRNLKCFQLQLRA
jgi:hypothetical protein